MSDQPDWDLLGRLFAGTASPEDRAEVRRWIEAAPSRRAFIQSMARVWEASAVIPEDWDAERAVAALARRMEREGEAMPAAGVAGGQDEPAPRPRRMPRRSGAWWPAVGKAAVLAALLGAGAFGVWRFHEGWEFRQAETVVFTTETGQRKSLELADGTRVLLNAASRLEVSDDFGRSERTVALSGEALFEVTQDAARPFLVETGEATTRVLGTRFDVRAYPEEAGVDVVVAEGKVAVEIDALAGESEPVVLTSGQLGRVNTREGTTVVEAVHVGDHLAWTKGRLVFRDAPLSEVLRRLEHWYDVDFRIEDPRLARRSLTATLDLGRQSIGEVLGAIALSVTATYRVDDRTVVFAWKD